MQYSLDKKTEDKLKLKLVAELMELTRHYWNNFNVDGITLLTCIEQLSKAMAEDLTEKLTEKMKEKFEKGIGHDLEIKDLEEYLEEGK